MRNRAYLIKIALFATGLSGIVAEYILATLATYFLGDSVTQWTLIISLMLFFMGIGSRLTRFIDENVYTWFVGVEFLLSVLVSFAAVLTYGLAGMNDYIVVWIYGIAIFTGMLIGMELPLAMRLNEQFESLKVNVSSILEKDYYGSLLGGVFFAFIGLPILGLTYTPFILGGINMLVALLLLNFLPEAISKQRQNVLNIIAAVLVAIMITGAVQADKIILFGEQKKYLDKVVYSEQTRYQKIVMTQWKDNHWLYLNGNLQFCTYDEALYHEVLVHPAVRVAGRPGNVLILGGGDGCAARELLKYESIEKITLVDLDPAMTRLGKEHPVLLEVNQGALLNERVEVINQDGFNFLEKTDQFYDLMIIDLPDPRSVELSRLYSLEFYQLCRKKLRNHGVLVTQAGSPYFATRSFKCIDKTVATAGFSTIPMHNQVITMGEWGWILAAKDQIKPNDLIARMKSWQVAPIPTRWFNNEAIDLITSFGKDFFDSSTDSVLINRVNKPVLQKYYNKGSWDLY